MHRRSGPAFSAKILVPLARLERARLAANDFEWAETMLSI